MRKFIYFLLICSKIVEIICVGEDYASSSSQRDKGKRKREDDNSDENSSNSNELPKELIANPSAHWFQESMLITGSASTDKNVSNSLPLDQHHTSMQGPKIEEEGNEVIFDIFYRLKSKNINYF